MYLGPIFTSLSFAQFHQAFDLASQQYLTWFHFICLFVYTFAARWPWTYHEQLKWPSHFWSSSHHQASEAFLNLKSDTSFNSFQCKILNKYAFQRNSRLSHIVQRLNAQIQWEKLTCFVEKSSWKWLDKSEIGKMVILLAAGVCKWIIDHGAPLSTVLLVIELLTVVTSLNNNGNNNINKCFTRRP